MSDERMQEQMGWLGRFTARFNIRLAGAAGGVLLALLIAPGTRRLVLSQMGLTVPFPATVASLAGSALGVHPDPFEHNIAFHSARVVAARHPADLQIQLANAVLLDNHASSSKDRVRQLRALESRFADRPELYANILRYEAMGEIKAGHLVEQCNFTGTPPPKSFVSTVDQAAYAAYDRDAAAGERLDPDNAYFSFMRAVGLYGAGHDQEAIAEIARAADKPLWREYYDEELKGQWRLEDESSVNNSALFHSLSAAALLFPQYAQIRGSARVTIYLAMKAEQAGRIDEGLMLRKNILRIGSLMRVQANSLIGSLVGIALTAHAIERPDGVPPIHWDSNGNERKEQEYRELRRHQFDAYLQRVGRAGEVDAFSAAQRAGDATQELVLHDMGNGPFDKPLQHLLIWWCIDLLTLSNILWLLVFGGLATLFLRNRRLQTGQALPRYARLALPLGLIGGALVSPIVLTFFQEMEFGQKCAMLLIGLAPALLFLVLPAKTRLERWQRLGIFGASLLAGMLLTGLFFWQARGLAGIAELAQIYTNLSSENGQSGWNMAWASHWSTAGIPVFILFVAAIISLACRVPLSVGLARAFRGLMMPVAAVLFLAYGVMMLCTVRAEASVQYGLERTLDNEGRYIADVAGKLWPLTEVAKKMVGH